MSSSVAPGPTPIASRTWAGNVTWRFDVILRSMAYSVPYKDSRAAHVKELPDQTRVGPFMVERGLSAHGSCRPVR